MVDVILLALAAPLLYFPEHLPRWSLWCAFGLLAVQWLWRRLRLGFWSVRTPADWPLLFLVCVMLPIAIWAAPLPLRQEFSWPRTYVLIWNICLFGTVVTYSSLDYKLMQIVTASFMACGVGIAAVAPLGMNWLYKFRSLDVILQRIPKPLIGVFHGADSGFHPNQVSGTLLYVLPLMLVFAVKSWRKKNQRRPIHWLLMLGAVFTTLVLFATQSRGGLLGFGIGIAAMILLPSKPGRWLLGGAILLLLMLWPFLPVSLFELISDAPSVDALGGVSSLSFRQEVWTYALQGIHDFPLTGIGFGTFRELVRLIYPITIDPTYNLGHAHNFFLQGALDFGIPGLIALLAIYLTATVQLSTLWRKRPLSDISQSAQLWRTYAVGFAGCLVAQTVYSQLDAVTLGSKTNFMFWYLFALLYGTANLSLTSPKDKLIVHCDDGLMHEGHTVKNNQDTSAERRPVSTLIPCSQG
ncbi:hypothetical protein BH10CHL1_BH10CHL1_44050 [soil metagenome]